MMSQPRLFDRALQDETLEEFNPFSAMTFVCPSTLIEGLISQPYWLGPKHLGCARWTPGP